MNFPFIDTNNEWFFTTSDSSLDIERSANIKKENDKIVVTIGVIVIEFSSYDPKRNELIGRFTIKDSNLDDEIIMRVEDMGKKLIGRPEGFNSRGKTWTICSREQSKVK